MDRKIEILRMIQKASRMVPGRFRAMWGAISASYLPGSKVDGLPGIAVVGPKIDHQPIMKSEDGN